MDRQPYITANGVAAGFSYDSDGLLTRVGSLNITRDSQTGLIIGTSRNNITSSASHNSFGEVTGLTAAYAGSALWTTGYTRDKLGRIATKTETIGGATNTYTYGYDSAGRLTDAWKGGTLIGHYEYDSNSNRLIYTGTGGAINGAFDAQDRLLSYGNNAYTYTPNGELLTKTDSSTSATTAYNYDVLGNLISATLTNGTAVEYIIDGRNRRIGKKVNGTLVQGFLYANQLNPIFEMDGSGNYAARYMYGTSANVPDYMARPDGVYRIFSDHLGSPRLVVNADTGAVVQRIDYDEFGNITQDTNPGFQPFGFAGGIYDQHTKLTRFGARDYDAETGRWTAKDPIGFNGGDANLYGYVVGDPVNFVDPLGLWGFGLIGSGSAEGGIGILGGGVTGSAGGGIFGGGSQGVNTGGFGSFGVFLGGPGYGPSYPGGNSGNSAIGAFAGAGGGGFITNAQCASQLSGPFNTYSFNLGHGPIKFSVQFGISNGTWIGSVTVGPGIGISGSGYPTNTWPTK